MIQKNLVSLCCICVFIVIAIGCKSIATLDAGSFNKNNIVEDTLVKGNFLVTNEGAKITGKEINRKSGLLSKTEISIDEQKFKISEIRGYREDNIYYARLGTDYIRRIVHGKINLYYAISMQASSSTDDNRISKTSFTNRSDHYVQEGEDGPLKWISDLDDIKKLLSDCPISVQIVDIKFYNLYKEIQKDPNYLNKAFEVYNNNCKSE